MFIEFRTKFLSALLVAILASGALTTTAAAQALPAPAIGIVDVQRILQESKAAKSIRPQVDKLRQDFQSRVRSEEQSLRQAEQDLLRQQAILSPEAFAQRRREFGERARAAQKAVQDRKQELDRAVGAAQSIILQNLIAVAQDAAKARNLNVVLEKRFVFISTKTLDLTPEVLQRLDKRLSSVSIDLSKTDAGGAAPKGKK